MAIHKGVDGTNEVLEREDNNSIELHHAKCMTRIAIDPITRIEGHLRIEVQVDGGAVTDAWASSTMWRGIELILKGRDPRDAWAITQRICGV